MAANHSPQNRAQVESLTRICAAELLDAFGVGGARRGRRVLELIARVPARNLARQAATYDEIVGDRGLAAGGEWALARMARRIEVAGRENLPSEGPLLIAANHPGLADAVALFTATPRDDLRVIAAERPFLRALPNTSRYLLTVAEDSGERLGLVRRAARHLGEGGALLTFPGGKIEPDPAALPGGSEALRDWSGSLDFFARLVPGVTIVPAIVSGVVSRTALRTPLVLVRRREKDRRWLAATLQMLVPVLYNVTARVEFGTAIQAGESAREEVLQEARRLIKRCEAVRAGRGDA